MSLTAAHVDRHADNSAGWPRADLEWDEARDVEPPPPSRSMIAAAYALAGRVAARLLPDGAR